MRRLRFTGVPDLADAGRLTGVAPPDRLAVPGIALLHRIVRAVVMPFRLLISRWQVIVTLTRRDLRSRYANSMIGVSWAVIQPLVLLLLYTFVFSVILRVRLGETSSPYFFAAYVFAGMLPWIAFQEGLVRSSTAVLENVPLIKKVVFPSEVLPVSIVFSTLVLEIVGVGVFILVLSVFYRIPGLALFALPLVIAFQVMFTVGLGWVLASLTVFMRDVGQLLGLGMTLWLFITPIFYPAEMVPPSFGFLLWVNPMHYLVSAYRDILLSGIQPDLSQFGVFAAVAFAVFVTGGWIFRSSSHAFVDVI